MIRQNLLTELHKGTEFYFCSIQVISTEGNMPWHGVLRAETGIFYFAELKEYSLNYRRTFLNKMIMELKSLRF